MVPKRVLKPAPHVAPALPPVNVQPAPSKLSPYFDEEAEAVMGLPPTPMEKAPEEFVPESIHAPAQAGLPPTPAGMLPPPSLAAESGLATPMNTGDDVPLSPDGEDGPASKKARICMIAGVEYEHEDDHNYTTFTDNELDALEECEFGLTSDDVKNEVSTEDVLLQQLIFPYSEHEPQLTPDQIAHLDSVAMQVETMRLKQMGVLLPPETLEGLNPKRLSTRYVITWRDKVLNGQRCWLRRARYVAREYAWLSPERQDLFSPASSNVANRLLPTLYLHWKHKYPEKKFILSAIDVGDAFLTVTQKQPTIVTSGSETYALGRVLPGQRDGSQLWFESVSGFLNEKLGFEHCAAYPSLLRSPGGECLLLLHVDDMLVLTDEQYFNEKLMPALSGKYKTSVHCMCKPGDTFEFLKRIHVLVDDETIHVQQNPRHFDKLFDVVGVQSSLNPKKVPCHELMNEVDETPALDPCKASRYRSAVGVLLYLASDLVECAYTIRGLAQTMSSPTERSWTMLKHLCLYLLSVRDHSLRLQMRLDGLWHSPCSQRRWPCPRVVFRFRLGIPQGTQEISELWYHQLSRMPAVVNKPHPEDCCSQLS